MAQIPWVSCPLLSAPSPLLHCCDSCLSHHISHPCNTAIGFPSSRLCLIPPMCLTLNQNLFFLITACLRLPKAAKWMIHSLLEDKVHDSRDFSLFCSLSYLQCLQRSLAHLLNVWINAWVVHRGKEEAGEKRKEERVGGREKEKRETEG